MVVRKLFRAIVRQYWRVRIWYARRQVRSALNMIQRQMDRVGMSRTARRNFYRELVPDRFEYLRGFWRG
jgi:hypothetical protein